jgi:peptidyl-tRNA hydrolase
VDTDADTVLLAATIDEWRDRWRRRVVDEDREHDEPWALPLVVRVERAAPPSHSAAIHAAALSVVRLLSRPEVAPDGPWHSALARWSDGRIRKVVRRARASRWDEIATLPGATAAVHDAEVRALLPHPVADPPPALARLQIAGLDLPKGSTIAAADASAAPVLMIATAPGLALTTGKVCAQVGHASQLALLQLDRRTVLHWAAAGHPLRIVEPEPAEWDRLLDADRDVAVVQDGGFTEVAPGTHTCAATFDRIDQRDPVG